jgi:drug/metabolite transporter (DMT)-like permease
MLANRPWPRPGGGTALRLFAMGFFGVLLYNVCFFNGLRTVPAGRASLMAALQPSIVFLFSAIVWGERVTPMRVAGLAVSFSGALLVLSGGDPARLFTTGLNSGDLWILGCVLSWVAYTLLGRTLAGRMSAGPATAYSTWMGTLLLFAMYLVQPGGSVRAWSLQVILASVFLGLLGTTVAFLLFLKGIGQIGASRASIFVNLVPVFGVLFSAVILREPQGSSALAGGALVIAGVRLLNR